MITVHFGVRTISHKKYRLFAGGHLATMLPTIAAKTLRRLTKNRCFDWERLIVKVRVRLHIGIRVD